MDPNPGKILGWEGCISKLHSSFSGGCMLWSDASPRYFMASPGLGGLENSPRGFCDLPSPDGSLGPHKKTRAGWYIKLHDMFRIISKANFKKPGIFVLQRWHLWHACPPPAHPQCWCWFSHSQSRTSLDSTYLIKKRHQVNWANLKPSIRHKKAATSATQPIIFSGATWRKNNPREKTLLPSLKLTAVSTWK